MSQLITILRAAHCRSTHHFFALDAIEHLETPRGKMLGQLLLCNYHRYLEGSKDPDTQFKDFQNHVLHVSDNLWGGAPRACEKWLQTAINDLNTEEWEDAAYSLGVLSHYFTDPIMPLHTGSSDGEGVVHRPMEWSICKAYDELYEHWQESNFDVRFELSDGSGWIRDAVIAGAEQSHLHYDRLIEIYDLKRGVKRPPEGLNAEARDIVAEMFAVAITGWARILERVADEINVPLPNDTLTIPTLVAAIDVPVAWVIRKISNVKEQRAVKAIFKEYEQTGTVRENLPPEIRKVRTEMALTTTEQDSPSIEQTDRLNDLARASENRRKAESLVLTDHRDKTGNPPSQSQPRTETIKEHSNRDRVSPESDLVDAPSIGPKTAKRFEKVNIRTIGQFVAADPLELENDLAVRWINAELIEEWQCQAQLVCDVASLCGYKSQLLVAVDCRDSESLAQASAGELAAKIEDFCNTKAGERILRSSTLPDETDISGWIRDAQELCNRKAA